LIGSQFVTNEALGVSECLKQSRQSCELPDIAAAGTLEIERSLGRGQGQSRSEQIFFFYFVTELPKHNFNSV